MGHLTLEYSFIHLDLHLAAIGNFILFAMRYALMAGITYYLLWHKHKSKFISALIPPALPPRSMMYKEIGWSLLSILVFSLLAFPVLTLFRRGWSHYYFNINTHGWTYFLVSVVVLIFIHDSYFYWCHRFMHWPPVYNRIHSVHHRFNTPSPMAAFAFHPGEAFLEAIIFSSLPLFVPLHPYAIVICLTYMTFMNVLGHLAYEFYPKGFTKHGIGQWLNTSTHHAMHHRFSRCNYGLYFNFWDRICGTNHPKYHEHFERVATRRQAQNIEMQSAPAESDQSKTGTDF